MTEPQIWVLIGVFAAANFGMMGIITTSFNRNLHTAMAGLRGELMGEIKALRHEMNARFETMDVKFAALDKDVQALMRHAFGTDSH